MSFETCFLAVLVFMFFLFKASYDPNVSSKCSLNLTIQMSVGEVVIMLNLTSTFQFSYFCPMLLQDFLTGLVPVKTEKSQGKKKKSKTKCNQQTNRGYVAEASMLFRHWQTEKRVYSSWPFPVQWLCSWHYHGFCSVFSLWSLHAVYNNYLQSAPFWPKNIVQSWAVKICISSKVFSIKPTISSIQKQ